MKTPLARLLFIGIAVMVVALPGSFAQEQLGKKKGPTSKLYLAETIGETQIQTGDKIYEARQATAFDAPGTVIETKEDSHNAFVYSNGTGMFMDQNTRIEINHFVQEPFNPDRNTSADALLEPSVSQSDVHVSRGIVGICTSQLVSGSSMTYSTAHGLVNIRGGRISIQTDASGTIVDLLEGDVTVHNGEKDIGGQVLRPGERAVIRPGAAGQPPTMTIGPIPPEVRKVVDDRVTIACNARRTVTFETIEKKADEGLDRSASAGTEDVVAKPTVPANPPSNIVVSPDRLPGG